MIRIDDFEVSNLIKKLREQKGLNLTEFADALGVSKMSASNWEKGFSISLDNYIKISKFFDITVDELMNGKINIEVDNNYLSDNYNLNFYYERLHDEFDNYNSDFVSKYYKKCFVVKNMFKKLLFKWAYDDLNEDEKKIFDYIKNYFLIDCALLKNDISISISNFYSDTLKNSLKPYLDRIKSLNSEEFDWEYEKLVCFSIPLFKEETYARLDFSLVADLFPLLRQQEKDELLYKNTNLDSALVINNLALWIKYGANYIYTFKTLHPGKIEEKEIFDLYEGKVTKDEQKQEAAAIIKMRGLSYSGTINVYDYVDQWKQYTYSDYLKTVNTKKNNYVLALSNLKNKKPYEYYQKLFAHEYDLC